jgi:hypothetical protein
MTHRRTLGIAGMTFALAFAAMAVNACDEESESCTAARCQAGNFLCCAGGAVGTWNVTTASCVCGTAPDADADADGTGEVGADADVTVETETGPDADADADGDAGTCGEYPAGPYSFAWNQRVAPMAWPTAIISTTETLAADLAVLRCDPDVHSIFIQATATDCSSCPSRMEMIADGAATWEANGAKWVIVVATLGGHVGSMDQVRSYVERFGIDFGFWTNDADNTGGAYTVADSSIRAAVPWTGVIRPSTMELVCDEPDDAYLDLNAISAALAANPDADLSALCTRH